MSSEEPHRAAPAMRKTGGVRPLSEEDPIWNLVGAGEGGHDDVAEAHDRHLADGELARWHGSSWTRAPF